MIQAREQASDSERPRLHLEQSDLAPSIGPNGFEKQHEEIEELGLGLERHRKVADELDGLPGSGDAIEAAKELGKGAAHGRALQAMQIAATLRQLDVEDAEGLEADEAPPAPPSPPSDRAELALLPGQQREDAVPIAEIDGAEEERLTLDGDGTGHDDLWLSWIGACRRRGRRTMERARVKRITRITKAIVMPKRLPRSSEGIAGMLEESCGSEPSEPSPSRSLAASRPKALA